MMRIREEVAIVGLISCEFVDHGIKTLPAGLELSRPVHLPPRGNKEKSSFVISN